MSLSLDMQLIKQQDAATPFHHRYTAEWQRPVTRFHLTQRRGDKQGTALN
jgi:hypothetical protein